MSAIDELIKSIRVDLLSTRILIKDETDKSKNSYITALAEYRLLKIILNKAKELRDKESPWISVKDRLPDKGFAVFVNLQLDGAPDNYETIYYGLLDDDGEWYAVHPLVELANVEDELLGYVTHWMPPPKPPGACA